MEKKLSTYINKLIELDARAVELKDKRASELAGLEAGSREELKGIEKILDEAALAAKQQQDKIIKEAGQQSKEISEAAELKINEAQAFFASIREDAVRDIWKQLLAIER